MVHSSITTVEMKLAPTSSPLAKAPLQLMQDLSGRFRGPSGQSHQSSPRSAPASCQDGMALSSNLLAPPGSPFPRQGAPQNLSQSQRLCYIQEHGLKPDYSQSADDLRKGTGGNTLTKTTTSLSMGSLGKGELGPPMPQEPGANPGLIQSQSMLSFDLG